MKVIDLDLGPEVDVKVDFAGGVLSVEVDADTAGLDGGLVLKVPVTYFIDALAAKFGASGQAVASMLDGLLKNIP